MRTALSTCELAERFVHGTEASIESFVAGGEVLFANPTEYLVPLHANVLPAPYDEETWRALRALNERALRAVGFARGMAHLELFLTPDGPLFGEVAARPPGGRLMHLLRIAWGFDPWRAVLELELGREPTFPARPRRTAGVWILHPGAGRVARISGRGAASAVPGVRKVRVRVRPGERIAKREGSGQDVGYIEASGSDRDAVARALARAHAALAIELVH